ncbi:MAG: hypothetical protein K2X65_08735 [Burkholderiaceae bacterium]|nr:hypothetical protein [Burkholderiaceae bacterium]
MTKHQQAVRGLSRAFFDSDLVATRLMLFVGELAWAVMLWWPGDTFARPTYDYMGQFANETLWAIAFTATALAQLHIVAFELHDSHGARAFAWWNAALWCGAVGMMLASVYPPPAAIGMEIAGALGACWIAVRPLILMAINRKVQKQTREDCHA